MAPRNKKNVRPYPLASIKVVGIGGGGGNAVTRMMKDFVRGVDFVAINTDHQDLDQCGARHKLYIGKNLTQGLGTGMNPELGRQAAEENRSEIAETLRGADLVFLAAGFGGGTGTGATSVVAEVAKQQGALTLAFVTKPFAFEGSQRDRVAQEGIARLRDKVDTLVVVPNDRIFSIISNDTPIIKAFEAIDDVMKNALRGIVELIITPGIINVDFADVKTIMQDAGSAIVGLGIASGQDRAVNAVNLALHSPLLEISPEGAKGILLGISGRDLKMNEINDAAKLVAQSADPSARIIFGAYRDHRLKANQLKVTLIASGVNGGGAPPSLFGGYFGGVRRPAEGDMATSSFGKGADMQGKKIEIEEFPSRLSSTADTALPLSQKPLGLKQEKAEMPKKAKEPGSNSDMWDIPTFLRRRKK